MRQWALLVLVWSLTSATAEARIPRSTAAVAAFKRMNPCPFNGATRGPCPGYEVDHVVPLCGGGVDAPANMQWLARADHRAKTRLDVMRCRRLRAAGN